MRREKLNGERHNRSSNKNKAIERIGMTAVSLVIAGGMALAVAENVTEGKVGNAIDTHLPFIREVSDMVNQITNETIALESSPENARNINEVESLYYEDENGRNMEFSFYSLGGEVLIDEEAFLEQISRSCELADEKYGYEEFDGIEENPLQRVVYVFCDTDYVNHALVEDRTIMLSGGEIVDVEQFRKYFTDEKIEGTSNRGLTMRLSRRNIDIVLLPTAPQELVHVLSSRDWIFDPQTRYSGSSVNDLVTLIAAHEALHVVTDNQANDNIEVDPDRIQNTMNSLDTIEICDKVVFYINENTQQIDESVLDIR